MENVKGYEEGELCNDVPCHVEDGEQCCKDINNDKVKEHRYFNREEAKKSKNAIAELIQSSNSNGKFQDENLKSLTNRAVLKSWTTPAKDIVKLSEAELPSAIVKKEKHDDLPFLCLECGQSFAEEKQLSEHVIAHTDQEADIGTDNFSQNCDSKLMMALNLKIPIKKSKRTGERLYKCIHDKCNKSYFTASELTRHVRVIHNGERVICGVCNKQFSYPQHLYAHMKEKHMKLSYSFSTHACETCGKSFPTSARLKRHKMTHEVDKPYKCRKCDKSYISVYILNQHVAAKHSNKRLECEFCEKTFKYPQHLQAHIRDKHTKGNREQMQMEYVKAYKEGELSNDVPRHMEDSQQCCQDIKNDEVKGHKDLNPEEVERSKNAIAEMIQSSNSNANGKFQDEKIKSVVNRPVLKSQTASAKVILQLNEAKPLNANVKKEELEDLPFLCLECGQSFAEEKQLSEHVITHTDQESDVDTYNISQNCDSKLLVAISHMSPGLNPKNSIIKSKHTGEHLYKCIHDKCDKSYFTASDLTRHVRVIHNGERVICGVCNKQFSYPQHLYAHMKEKHMKLSNSLSHACETCGKSFPTSARLKRHKMTHEVNKPYKCRKCDKSYISVYILNQHVAAKHSNKRLECEFCEKTFKYPQHLQAHIRDKHTEGEAYYGHCPYCSKKFPSAFRLKRHITMHTGDKSHKCDQCDKSYMTGSSLREHIRAVHQGKKLVCCFCSKQFRYRQHLYAHMRQKHSDKDPAAFGNDGSSDDDINDSDHEAAHKSDIWNCGNSSI